jgi:hypothetical protein
MRRPRGAARTLAHGWAADARRWTWATVAVLASTLVVLVGTAGLLEGTTQRTLDQVADFYTGDLRITPSRTGAIPADWFPTDAAAELTRAGATVAERVEAQFVLSRRSFVDTYLNERNDVPVGVPGSSADPQKVVTLGAVVGLRPADPGLAAINEHLVAGRLPCGIEARATCPDPEDAIEIVMSQARAEGFLTDAEKKVPGRLLDIVGTFSFDITSARLDEGREERVIFTRAKVVGLYATGVDILDSFTLVASARDVQYLLGVSESTATNVLAVQSGAAAASRVAAREGWATEATESFAKGFIGQMIDVLRAVAWLVSALLFLLPTSLIGHGIARQLFAQQRELAVATAIGVPTRTLAQALAIQVTGMAGWAALSAALVTAALWVTAPMFLPGLPAPLPLDFTVSPETLGVALAVTAVSVAVGLVVGLRSRLRMPLAASLRAG